MPKLGRYCKAYPVERLREFSGWPDGPGNPGRDNNAGPDSEAAGPDFLYIQEDYVVTAGVFADEDVVFDNVTPEWVEFCRERLDFEAPSYS